jgi:hypothetical protein
MKSMALVATPLPAGNHAAVVAFNGCSYRAAMPSWADSDATRANADGSVAVVAIAVPLVAVVPVPPDLNIDALGHLDAFGLGRIVKWTGCQRDCGCAQGESDPQHAKSSLEVEPV